MTTRNDMCDKTTRLWTCRIGLLITVCGVLCLMMFQIWTYYFSLVNQMDIITFASPEIKHIITWCKTDSLEWEFSNWNVDSCTVLRGEMAECIITNPIQNYFIDTNDGTPVVNQTSIQINLGKRLSRCGLIKIWQLPWGNNIVVK